MSDRETQSPSITAVNAAPPVEDPRQTPLIDARLAELTARYGDRFDDTQRAQVRARIARSVALGESLRKTALTNADEPEIVFAPYRTVE
jgi:hypothetical protein